MSFEKLNVMKEIVRALTEAGITTPTLIQEKAIPLIKAGKDVIGRSKTGSGKTAAFGIPILEMITPRAGLQALILTPTRELAVQISGVLESFGKYIHCSVATVYGGVSITPQIHKIARSEIVVSTPGRLLDHLERRTINLSKIRCVVLDEADKMVEMGFIQDVERILEHTPQQKQVLLFGATLSSEINNLKRKHMNDPIVAEAEHQVKEDLLAQYYYNVEPQEKFSLLVHLLKKEETRRVIIFCSTRSTVEIVARNLRQQGVHVEMIHGKLSQARRLSVIEGFNKGKPNVLVASSVAARGLDIKDISHVFNYDLSGDPQEYIHRIGRTARAGESGKAITLLSPKNHEEFGAILNRYRLDVEVLPLEDFPRLRFDAHGMQQRGFARQRFGRGGPSRHGGRSFHSRPSSRRSF